jgi:hypothetical protein
MNDLIQEMVGLQVRIHTPNSNGEHTDEGILAGADALCLKLYVKPGRRQETLYFPLVNVTRIILLDPIDALLPPRTFDADDVAIEYMLESLRDQKISIYLNQSVFSSGRLLDFNEQFLKISEFDKIHLIPLASIRLIKELPSYA